ncbi:MAG: metal-dependent hydrolase [Planctomyces sp.]
MRPDEERIRNDYNADGTGEWRFLRNNRNIPSGTMTTHIRFLGHGAFQIETSGRSVLIDPFLTGNPLASISADKIAADYIIVSHGHGDHVGDTIAIAQRTGATVIANHEIIQWFQKQGVQKTHDMHIGGSHRFDFGTVKLTIAHHGSMLPDGSYGGNPAGILLETVVGNIYHAADTGLFYDMKLIGECGLKVAILPIGDNYTMGPKDAIRATQFLQPEIVIPGHYNTFPVIQQNVQEWADSIRNETTAKPVILNPGESYTI